MSEYSSSSENSFVETEVTVSIDFTVVKTEDKNPTVDERAIKAPTVVETKFDLISFTEYFNDSWEESCVTMFLFKMIIICSTIIFIGSIVIFIINKKLIFLMVFMLFIIVDIMHIFVIVSIYQEYREEVMKKSDFVKRNSELRKRRADIKD
jgi:hypothetical protein